MLEDLNNDSTRGNRPDTTGQGSPYADPAVAAAYARIADPLQFVPPARDLVRLAQLERSALVLDVGTGTGAVARSAAAALKSGGLVIAVDASIPMLRFARETPACSVAAVRIPGLPFRDDSFDAVLAGFVVSHLMDYRVGLADLHRVCRIGGRVAMSTWGPLPNAASRLWIDTAGMFVPRDHLDEVFRAHIPWDEYFSDRVNLQQTVEDTGLTSILIETGKYEIAMTTVNFLLSREVSVQGMLVRRSLPEEKWEAFRFRVADVFDRKFGQRLAYVRDVHFAVGTKSRH